MRGGSSKTRGIAAPRGAEANDAKLFAEPSDFTTIDARWWSMRAALGIGEPAKSIRVANGLAQYDTEVTFEEKYPPYLPKYHVQRGI